MATFNCINMGLFTLRFWHFVWYRYSWWSTDRPFNPSHSPPNIAFKSGFYSIGKHNSQPRRLTFSSCEWSPFIEGAVMGWMLWSYRVEVYGFHALTHKHTHQTCMQTTSHSPCAQQKHHTADFVCKLYLYAAFLHQRFRLETAGCSYGALEKSWWIVCTSWHLTEALSVFYTESTVYCVRWTRGHLWFIFLLTISNSCWTGSFFFCVFVRLQLVSFHFIVEWKSMNMSCKLLQY